MKYHLLKEDDLYRVVCTEAFTLFDGSAVEEGTRGGLVEGGHNLSQEGSCWIGEGARVLGQSRVEGGAAVEGDSVLRPDASGACPVVSGQTSIDSCLLEGPVEILGDCLMDYCRVIGRVRVLPGGAVNADATLLYGELAVSGMLVAAKGSRVEDARIAGRLDMSRRSSFAGGEVPAGVDLWMVNSNVLGGRCTASGLLDCMTVAADFDPKRLIPLRLPSGGEWLHATVNGEDIQIHNARLGRIKPTEAALRALAECLETRKDVMLASELVARLHGLVDPNETLDD